MIESGINVPLSFKERLKEGYIHNWGRNTYIFEELATLLPALGSPVVLLKGAALLPTVYKDFGLRWMGDVDILIRPSDATKVNAALVRMGYQSDSRPRSYQISNYLNSMAYEKRAFPFSLHLHWHIINTVMPNYIYAEQIDTERLWTEAIPLKAGKVDAMCLSPHHQLLHLSEHAMKHSYDTLLLLWDIHRVIIHWEEKLDWEKLCNEAEDFQLTGPVFYSLWLCREFFGTRVPQGVLESLRPLRPGLGERAFYSLLRKGRRQEGLCWLFYLSRTSGWQKKLSFLLHSLLPPRDVLVHMEGINNGWQGGPYWKVLFRRLQRGLGLFSKSYQGRAN